MLETVGLYQSQQEVDQSHRKELNGSEYDDSTVEGGDLEQGSRALRSTAFLNGLRGLAAFLVYTSHHIPWWYGSGNPLERGFGYEGNYHLASLPFLRIFYSGGHAAVAIFFVLSGYVLSVKMQRLQLEGKIQEVRLMLVSALARRPLRLYAPAAAVSLIFALIMHLPFGLAPEMTWPVKQPSLSAEIVNWIIALLKILNPFVKHGIEETWFPYDPPVWTMAVELQGSILVFGMIGIFGYIKPVYRLYLLVLVGLLLLFSYTWAMACFVGGMILARNDLVPNDFSIWQRLSAQHTNIGLHAIFVMSCWLLGQPSIPHAPENSYNTPGWYCLTMITPRIYYNREYWRFWNTIGAFMLVYSVLRLQWMRRFFMTSWLQYLGRISFSLYLIHIPILWTVGDRVCRVFGLIRHDFITWFDYRIPVPDIGPRGLSLGFLASQMLILPFSMLVAEWNTRWIDEESVKASRWLVSSLGLASDRQSS